MLCQLTVIQALTQNPDTDESYNLEKKFTSRSAASQKNVNYIWF